MEALHRGLDLQFALMRELSCEQDSLFGAFFYCFGLRLERSSPPNTLRREYGQTFAVQV